MGRTLTNNVGLQYAIQDGFDDLGGSPSWKAVEPNGSIEWGAEITTVERNPISRNRQRRKGKIVDLDSGLGYEADLTIDSALDFGEGFLMSGAVNADTIFEGAAAGASGFTIPSSTAAQAAKFQFTSGGPISLVWSVGYALSANNGLFPLSADLGSAETTLQVAGLSTETPPTNSLVSLCGIRGEAGDLAMTVSSGVGTITSGNNAASNNIDFTTLGLTLGQFIHVGGVSGSTQPFSAASTNTYGFARVISIAAGTLLVDKLDPGNAEQGTPALVAFDGTDDNAAGTAVVIDLLFGRFIRNVPTDDSEFLERYYEFEAEFPNLFETTPPTPVANPDGFEYALNNLANSWALGFPLTGKALSTVNFVGTDTEVPVDNSARKTNADTPIEPLLVDSFNTSTDWQRLRILDVDESGLTTDFKDWTLTITNDVTPEKVQAKLGAKFMNTGNFGVSLEGTFVFTEPLVITRIRNNTQVTLDFILENEDGGLAFDIPSATLGNGGRDLPENASVLVNLTGTAYQDPTLGTSIGISIFPVTPKSFAA